jgi:hypothetical protein
MARCKRGALLAELLPDNDVQQRGVQLKYAIAFDEPQLTNFFMKGLMRERVVPTRAAIAS